MVGKSVILMIHQFEILQLSKASLCEVNSETTIKRERRRNLKLKILFQFLIELVWKLVILYNDTDNKFLLLEY